MLPKGSWGSWGSWGSSLHSPPGRALAGLGWFHSYHNWAVSIGGVGGVGGVRCIRPRPEIRPEVGLRGRFGHVTYSKLAILAHLQLAWTFLIQGAGLDMLPKGSWGSWETWGVSLHSVPADCFLGWFRSTTTERFRLGKLGDLGQSVPVLSPRRYH
eukprot:7387894-Prymnesium_polylepis.1